jgi:hypothetical protein
MPNAPKVAGAGKVGVSAEDQRPDKSRVAVKKNGYGMEMAAIESKRSVADYFREAMESELKNRGFQIGQGRRVNVTIIRFSNDFKIGVFAGDAVAELQMEVSVPDPTPLGLDGGWASTNKVLAPARAKAWARLIDRVDLPTPPFGLEMAMLVTDRRELCAPPSLCLPPRKFFL